MHPKCIEGEGFDSIVCIADFVGGTIEEGALLGSSPVGCLEMCEWGRAEVSRCECR